MWMSWLRNSSGLKSWRCEAAWARTSYSGSAAFFNKADFGIAIERDRTQGVTRVHVQKVKFRHLGYPGVASFQYNTHNGRFVPMEESKTPDLPNQDPVWDNSNWLGKKVPEQKRFDI